MGYGFKHGAGGVASLNYSLKAFASADQLPESAKVNTIAVITDTTISGYGFAQENPFIYQKDEDLLTNATLGDGFFSTSGSVSNPDGSHPEKYTVDIIPVEAGKTYRWEYSVSEAKEMWLCVAEYKGSTFSTRVVLVNAVNGTTQSGEYIPATGVDGVKLSWRTFTGTDCSVKFFDSVECVYESVKNGTVWISANLESPVAFNALKKNSIMVYPGDIFQYEDGAWVKKDAYLFTGSEWMLFSEVNKVLYLYINGDRNLEVTGDYHRDNPTSTIIVSDGTADDGTKFLNFPNKNDSEGLYTAYTMYTGNMIDVTDYSYLVEKSIHGRAGDKVQLRDSSKKVVAEVSTKNMSGMQTLVLDISSLTGSYYISFYNFNNGYDNWDLYELYLTNTPEVAT